MLPQPLCSWQTVLQTQLSFLSLSPLLNSSIILGKINKRPNKQINQSITCYELTRHLQWPHKWVSVLTAVRAHARPVWPEGAFGDAGFCHWMTQWTAPMVVNPALCLCKTLSLPAPPSFPWKVPCEFTSQMQHQPCPWGSLWLAPWEKGLALWTICVKASSWNRLPCNLK